MPDEIPLLTAHNLGRRSKDGQWLLHHVSVEVCTGERWAVTGPTGAGKTLLLRMLALLDPADEGAVLWNGCEIEDRQIPSFRRQVIYLHQRPVLIEGSVETNLRLPSTLWSGHRTDFEENSVREHLAEWGRDKSFLSQPAGWLSGGEAQIVALLRAMQLHPSLLLLDEPTAALDADSTAAVEALVDCWMKESPDTRALVWVSHDPAQVQRQATRRLSLVGGRVQEKGICRLPNQAK